MGAKAQISDAEIIEAGERLEAHGQDVNGWSLRTKLGGGKPERLLAVWKAHLETKKPKVSSEEPSELVLPPRLRDHADAAREQIVAFFDGIVVTAHGVAVDTIENRYREERDQLRATQMRYEQEIADANAAIEAADEREAQLEARLEQVTAERDAARRENITLTERMRVVEGSEQAKAARMSELEQSLADANHRSSECERDAAAANARATAAETETERLRADFNRRIADLEAQIKELAQSARARDEEASGLRADLAARGADLKNMREAHARQDDAMFELKSELKNLHAETKALSTTVGKREAELQAALAELQKLRKEKKDSASNANNRQNRSPTSEID